MRVMGKLKKSIIAICSFACVTSHMWLVNADDLSDRDTGFIADIAIDTTQTGSIEITYDDTDYQITGVTYNLYMIAEFHDNGKAYFTEEFYNSHKNDTSLDFNPETSSGKKYLAEALNGYVNRYGLTPVAQAVSNAGVVKFENVKLGYYLAVAETYETDTYVVTSEPSLIAVPGESTNGTYDSKMNAKYVINEKENEVKDFTVQKVWQDGGESTRPETIKIQLLRNGTPYGDVISIGSANNWTYTWNNLDAEYVWSAIEVEVPANYTINVNASSNTEEKSIITNKTKPTVPETPEGPPPTGDSSNALLYGGIGAVAVIIILGAVIARKKANQ